MTPAPSSPVPAVEAPVDRNTYLTRHHELTESAIGLAKLRLMRGENDAARRTLDDYSNKLRDLFRARLATMDAENATPTPGRAAEPDTMGEVERLVRTFSASINVFWTESQAGSRSDCLMAEQALLSAVRTIVTERDAFKADRDEWKSNYESLFESRDLRVAALVTRAETAEAQLATRRWQPIETAPKAGPIWAGWDGNNLARPKVCEEEAETIADWVAGYPRSAPTHWMPRQPKPTPPSIPGADHA